mgnify:CR=1 FL=1
MSTSGDVVGSGVPGLDSWTAGQALWLGDPGLAVEILAQRTELEAHGRLMLGLAELFDRPSLVSEQ